MRARTLTGPPQFGSENNNHDHTGCVQCLAGLLVWAMSRSKSFISTRDRHRLNIYKRYINDIARATSGTREEIEDFANFMNGFRPNLSFTWSIADGVFVRFCSPILDGFLRFSKDLES